MVCELPGWRPSRNQVGLPRCHSQSLQPLNRHPKLGMQLSTYLKGMGQAQPRSEMWQVALAQVPPATQLLGRALEQWPGLSQAVPQRARAQELGPGRPRK